METIIDSRAMNKKDKDEFNLSSSYLYHHTRLPALTFMRMLKVPLTIYECW